VLLATTGLVTAIPLICFGGAAIRIPMTTLGLLQYLAPTIQFLLGLLVFHESMTFVKWIGFALVWLALAIFTGEALRGRQQQIRMSAEAAAV
jgi:chloramphenicol-sensitive protein RarD